MELDNTAKENVWMEVLRAMSERELAYKRSIDIRIEGIKKRQQIAITIASLALCILTVILYLVIRNINDMTNLIKTLSLSFQNFYK